MQCSSSLISGGSKTRQDIDGEAAVEELPAQGLTGLQRACCATQGAPRTPVPAQPPQEHWQRMSMDVRHSSKTLTANTVAPGSLIASKLRQGGMVPMPLQPPSGDLQHQETASTVAVAVRQHKSRASCCSHKPFARSLHLIAFIQPHYQSPHLMGS